MLRKTLLKKASCFFLAFTLSTALLTGCEGSAQSKEEPEKKSITVDHLLTTSEEDSIENQITIWCESDNDADNFMIESAAKTYAAANPDFSLRIDYKTSDEFHVALSNAKSTSDFSDLPDIYLLKDKSIQGYVAAYPDAFAALNEYHIDYDRFPVSKVSYSLLDDTYYGIPFELDTAVFAYRLDFLNAAGLTLSNFTNLTWNAFIKNATTLCTITEHPLFSCIEGDASLVISILQSAGGSLYTENGKLNLTNNSLFLESIDVYQRLLDSGVMVIVNNEDEYQKSIRQSSVIGALAGSSYLKTLEKASDMTGLWGITNMPRLDYISTATNYADRNGTSWVVNSNCKNIPLAVDFLKSIFAHDVEYYNTLYATTNMIGSYIPSVSGNFYGINVDFFAGQSVATTLIDYQESAPSFSSGANYDGIASALGDALKNVREGSNLMDELAAIEANY